MPRPRTPTRLLHLYGTYRSDRHKGRGDCSQWTPDSGENPFDKKQHPDAFAHWNALAPRFLELALLTVTSRETLIHICMVYEDIEVLQRKIRAEGLFVMYPVFSRKTGELVGEEERVNNATKPKKQAIDLYNRLLNEFGGNPASESKVASQIKNAPKTNPFGIVR